MLNLRAQQPGHASLLSPDYDRAFRMQVHQLIKMGYDRMAAASYAAVDELEITQDLRSAIQDVLNDPRSGKWVDAYFLCEDFLVEDGERRGKKRLKVDIVFEATEQRPRPRFSFEAKRLGKTHPVSIYLGAKGMGCFLSGAYARDDDQAGMLGYVQSETPPRWADRIEAELRKDPSCYSMPEHGQFSSVGIVDGLDHTYRSNHDRPCVGRRVSIFHTLLQFN
ncbi:MAG: hypothetical protein KAV82_06080 [Phycisphaerae bacterium]|nr:hypothetical protein [Phycisphaerae bacterium]